MGGDDDADDYDDDDNDDVLLLLLLYLEDEAVKRLLPDAAFIKFPTNPTRELVLKRFNLFSFYNINLNTIRMRVFN